MVTGDVTTYPLASFARVLFIIFAYKMKTKQIDQLKRARTGLRGWMTRDIKTVKHIMGSDSPEVTRVESKLDLIVTRLQKAKDLQMEIEKQMNNDGQV